MTNKEAINDNVSGEIIRIEDDAIDQCIELARQYRNKRRNWFSAAERSSNKRLVDRKANADFLLLDLLKKIERDFTNSLNEALVGIQFEFELKHLCRKMHSIEPNIVFWACLIDVNVEVIKREKFKNLRWLKDQMDALSGPLIENWRKRNEREQELREESRIILEEEERKRQEEEKRRLVAEEINNISSAFQADFLGADEYFRQQVKHVSEDEFEELKHSFVAQWCQEKLTLELDKEQVAAVAAVNGNVRVTARAGSGKTRVLIARAIFLIRHCGVAPSKILLLAFNRKAAIEMNKRLSEQLEEEEIPFVMTFHALAHAIVHPEKTLIYDDPKGGETLSRYIQQAIDERIRSANSSDTNGKQIQKFMLTHFRADWERLIDGMYQLPHDEFLKFCYALPYNTIDGKEVKSFGEKLIGNTLFENAIEYKYEKVFYWDHGIYRPDFTVAYEDSNAKKGIVIEYFGLSGDADYDEMSSEKRAYWQRKNDDWDFLEYTPADINRNGKEQFADDLILKLEELGIESRKRSDDEIWEIIKDRSLDEFTGTMKNFISRCLNLDISPGKLDELIVGHSPQQPAEKQFLQIAPIIYREFLTKLKEKGATVFASLVKEASRQIVDGHVEFCRDRGRVRGNLKEIEFVSIDEFQDFTPLFYKIIEAMKSVNSQFHCLLLLADVSMA